jgi:alpha-glucoside transport system substrate-binding protein
MQKLNLKTFFVLLVAAIMIAPLAPTIAQDGGTELEQAMAGAFEGTEVSVFTVWVEAEGESFQAVLDSFSEQTGIEVIHEGSPDFSTLITVRVEAGDAPDLAVFPQPGLMASLARDGAVVDLGQFMDMEQLQADYIQSWIDLGTVDGQLAGIFFRASTKSLVWYPVPQFEEAGYQIPQTWDEMIALSDQMVADGNTPWCISIEHGSATGWVATDWLEEIMLRTAGPEVYDQWVNHEIPFNDPSVKNAAEIMAQIWFNEDYVLGGTTGILTTFVGDTQTPMFDEAGPGCWMHRQAGWIPSFFPEGKTAPEDSTFFYLPPIDEAQGRPALGGGDVVSMLNDRPEVRALIQYLATPEAAHVWIDRGGFISPHNGVELDWYTNPVDRAQAEILQNATVFRFDASDLMPGSVGTGTFWTGMVDWISGEDLDTVLQAIEDSWPEDEG